MRFEFTITGKTALLMHADDVMWADEMTAWRLNADNAKKKGESSGDDRRPAFTWTGYLYSDGKYVSIPSGNLQAALSKGGSRVPRGRQQTFKEIAVSGLFFEAEFLSFTNNGKQIPVAPIEALRGKPLFAEQKKAVESMGFRLDVRRATIGTSKHVRVRPRFDLWTATGSLEVTDERITPEILDAIFEQAGKCGIGDWRPSSPKKPGTFGMFGHKLKRIK